ncbi:MAG TPA: penicillin acylase family protein [Candidatus Acidoferrales bacterium]|nr:penicillin acylase family protein [Candidatus Acidoferrales bacterium]
MTKRWPAKSILRRLAIAIMAIAAALAAPASAAPPSLADALAKQVLIYRDSYGVPHIFGGSDASVVFGLMYAEAEDNFWQIEDEYIRALGRAAEVYGPSQLLGDVLVRATENVSIARAEYARMDPGSRKICDAFAAGLNFYLEKHPETKPRLLTHFEPWYVLAMQLGSARGALNRFGIKPAEIAAAFPELAKWLPPETAEPASGADLLARDANAAASHLDEGSNMWAVGPSKTAGAGALLLINPHVGFFGGGQRYEAQLDSRQGLHVSGFAMLGYPYIWSGFTPDHGWSHTNNYAYTVALYAELFDDPAHPLEYRYGPTHRAAVQWTEQIPVLTASGVVQVPVTFRKTHHGPILAVRDSRPLAARIAGYDRLGRLEECIAMAKARNLKQFQAALARRALIGSNTIYADRQGNIYYVHGDLIPRHNPEIDWTRPVDGSDPKTEWQGYHAFADLPQMTDPKSGYLQNSNSTPFLMTGADNHDPDKYPSYMAPEPETLRADRARQILGGAAKFTFDQWTRAVPDTMLLAADHDLPSFFGAYEQLQATDSRWAAELAPLVAEWKKWDHVAALDSVPTTIFVLWEERLTALRKQEPPLADLDVVALEQVKTALERDFGAWRVPWGQINRLQRVHTSGTLEPFSDARPSLPVPAAPSVLGSLFAFNTRTPPGQKLRYGVSGNSYVAVVEFGKRVQARSIVTFGQSADPRSPHFFDQAPLYAAKQFKPAWFYRKEVAAHSSRPYHPGD